MLHFYEISVFVFLLFSLVLMLHFYEIFNRDFSCECGTYMICTRTLIDSENVQCQGFK